MGFYNNATIVGTVKSKNFNTEIGSNGLANITLTAGDDECRIKIWGKDDGSVDRYITQLEEDTKLKITGNLSQNLNDGTRYLDVQPYGLNGIKEVGENERERAVANIDGDVFMINPQDDMEVNLEVLVFNTYNRDGDEDLTRAEVLQNELKRNAEWLDKNTDKGTDFLREYYDQLDVDDSVTNVIDIYSNLIKEAPDLNYYNIEQLTITVEEDLYEEVLGSDLMVGSNAGFDVYIINRMVTNEFGRAAGSESGLILGNFVGINEQPDAGLDETAEDGNDRW